MSELKQQIDTNEPALRQGRLFLCEANLTLGII